MSKQKLKAISGKLKKASKAHASQAKQIDSMLKMKKKPSNNTLDSMVRPFDMSKDAKKLNKIFEPKKKEEVKIGNTTYTVSDKKQSTMKLRRFPKGSKGHQKRTKKVGKFIETGIQKSINLVNKIRKSPTSAATGFSGFEKIKNKKSPALKKLSASCKAAAKRKFKVYPSAYANMWAAKTQRQGKC